ncbi:MAG: hypothetical protein ABI939_08275 [Anaerolineaceae bacterium]
MNRDAGYYRRRAAEERRAGMAATSEKAPSCHLEIAAAYDDKVTALAAGKRRSTLHIATATPSSPSKDEQEFLT